MRRRMLMLAPERKHRQGVLDWETIAGEYRAGQLSIAEIARQNGCSRQAIIKRAKKEAWGRDLSEQVRQEVSARLVTGTGTSCNTHEAIETAAARGVEVVRQHRVHLAKLHYVSTLLLDGLVSALEALKEGGKPDLSFLNSPRESLSDVLMRISQCTAKLIPLERQAFNLNEKPEADPLLSLADLLKDME